MERIVKGIQRKPRNFEQLLRNLKVDWQNTEGSDEDKIERLRRALFQRAESNFEMLFTQRDKKTLESAHEVHQSADWGDGDANLVSLEQCERVWWNDSRSGQKKAAVREGVVSVQIFD